MDMDRPDSASLRQELQDLATSELIEALADREREEWLPEAYSMMEMILRERGVELTQAVEAARESLPDPRIQVELVTVATVLSPLEGQLIRMRLEQAGIAVHVADENLAGMGLGFVAGGVKILVAATDVESATNVLAEPPQPAVQECPTCSSNNIEHQERRDRATTVVLALLGSTPIPLVRHFYRCRVCEHSWEE